MMTSQSKNRVSLLENDGQLAATFLIGNFSAKQKIYSIHCFIDYDEIPCSKDASIGVKTRSFEEANLSIQPPSSGDTTLDLLVLAVDQSDNDEPIHLFHRANIIRSKSRKISGRLADNERPTSTNGILLTPTIRKSSIRALLENGVDKKSRFKAGTISFSKEKSFVDFSDEIFEANPHSAINIALPMPAKNSRKLLVFAVENPFSLLEKSNHLTQERASILFSSTYPRDQKHD
jgi:hypothetical protein